MSGETNGGLHGLLGWSQAALLFAAALATTACESPEQAASPKAPPHERPPVASVPAETTELPPDEPLAMPQGPRLLLDFEEGPEGWIVGADVAKGAQLPTIENCRDTQQGSTCAARFRFEDPLSAWHYVRKNVDSSDWQADSAGFRMQVRGRPFNGVEKNEARFQLREADGEAWDASFGDAANSPEWTQVDFRLSEFRLRKAVGDGKLDIRSIVNFRFYASFFSSGLIILDIDDLELLPPEKLTPAD